MPPTSAPIPLLLVADSAETCERIASALLSAPVFYRIERLTTAELVQRGAPPEMRLALVDHDLRGSPQAAVVRQLNAAGVATVALVDQHNVQSLQEVVLAGAADLVGTPFVDTQLWETVARALSSGPRPTSAAPMPGGGPNRPARAGLLAAIYAPKSGSGTSVLAANLAIALQSMGPRGAALIEVGEGTGSQAILLNLRGERTMGDLLARFDPDDAEFLKGVLTPHPSGLKVLLGPPSASLRIPSNLVEDVIDAMQLLFDYVVIDLHATAMSNTVATMRKAHAALVVVVPEMTCLSYARQFVDTMEATLPEVALNIILNRSNLPNGVPPDAIRRHMKMQIAIEIPDDQALVTTSVNRGVPCIISHPRSGVSKAIQQLAQNLRQPEPRAAVESAGLAPAPQPSPLGWLSRGGRR